MLHEGENAVCGIVVGVERKRVRHINLRVRLDGRVMLSVPRWGATLREAEAFLHAHWDWVLAMRAKVAAMPPEPPRAAVAEEERARLAALLDELHASWCARLGEQDVTWEMRAMKSLWGSCHRLNRHVTYNLDLAHLPREFVEYVVVHELTHLKTLRHGALFGRLMDERLPGWRELRRRLNRRDYAPPAG